MNDALHDAILINVQCQDKRAQRRFFYDLARIVNADLRPKYGKIEYPDVFLCDNEAHGTREKQGAIQRAVAMTVYVDEFGPRYGKWAGGGHMIADDLDELHEMARRLGLKRSWFQNALGPFPHYDLTRGKRLEAIKQGAVPTELRDMPAIARAIKEQQ